ncbi:MAG: phenylpyruvate tautomerase MIF-related protein [Chthoniobacteraceae bacterium]|nr:phenylpyruvate tautomerase MIF-related protein [Chthoniobacteraceae bacterium]
MPSLSITTNAALSPEAESALAAAASKILSAGLEKPEDYVMVSVQSHAAMRFADSEEPAAFLDLRSIGLPGDLNPLAQALTGAVNRHAHVPLRRVYLTFANVPARHWAHGGGTFA